MTKDGYFAAQERTPWGAEGIPYASIGYNSYNRNIDELVASFINTWNKEHRSKEHNWHRTRAYIFEDPMFQRPCADIEVAIEFSPVRIVRKHPYKFKKIRVTTGASLVSELIEKLKPV